jgi:hypothetical protein
MSDGAAPHDDDEDDDDDQAETRTSDDEDDGHVPARITIAAVIRSDDAGVGISPGIMVDIFLYSLSPNSRMFDGRPRPRANF